MSSPFSLSMNSSRRYEEKQNVNKDCNLQNEKEKEDKLRELIDKNERLEKECLKFQIQVKNLEDKLHTLKEKEYKSQNNTSSNFLLPSEFRKLWEDFAKESIGDILVDFFDDFILTFNLFQEIMIISHIHFKEELKSLTNKTINLFDIKNLNKSYTFVEKNIKPIILEYYDDILENENKANCFYEKIKVDYAKFINKNYLMFDETGSEQKEKNKSFIKDNNKSSSLIVNDKIDELKDLMKSSYIKDFLKTVKKIFLFIEFHDPQLSLKIESFAIRKPIIKQYKQTDCVCVDGYIKDVKNCLILLEPPLLKNGYPYSGLKPITLICPDNPKVEEFLEKKELKLTDIETNQIKNKELNLPVKSERGEKKHLSELEKKEKIINFILDHDKENELKNSIRILNENKINLKEINNSLYGINKDEIMNRSAKKHGIDHNEKYIDLAFSKNPNNIINKDCKNNLFLSNQESEKNLIGEKMKKIEEILDNNEILKVLKIDINKDKNDLGKPIEKEKEGSPFHKNILDSLLKSNLSKNPISSISLNLSKSKQFVNSKGNISTNSTQDLQGEKNSNNFNNSLNKHNTSLYSQPSNNNENQKNIKINQNVQQQNKPHLHDHNYNYRHSPATKTENLDSGIKLNENCNSLKSLVIPNNNMINSDWTKRTGNISATKDIKGDKSLNIINISNRIKDREGSESNIRKNSNDSNTNNNNSHLSLIKKKTESQKINSKNKVSNVKNAVTNIHLNMNLNNEEPLVSEKRNLIAKMSPTNKINSSNSKLPYNTELKKSSNQLSQQKEIGRSITGTNGNIGHKIIKKKPHEIQLTLTNQNFNFLIDEKNKKENKEQNLTKSPELMTNQPDKSNTNQTPSNIFQLKSKHSKKIRISELDQNYNEENLHEISKKSNTTSNNRSIASNSNYFRSTSDHQINKKKTNVFYNHSYSYSYININRLNILSSKKSFNYSTGVNNSNRVFENRKENFNEKSNENITTKKFSYEKNYQNYNLSSSNYINLNNGNDNKKTTKNSITSNQNYYSHLSKDSYKNRFALLSCNSQSNSKNQINPGEKKRSTNQASSGKLGVIFNTDKNERYNILNTNSYSKNKYLSNSKKFISKNNSNDFNSNNILTNLNNTNTNIKNHFNISKEKDFINDTNNNINNAPESKEKIMQGTSVSIRSYTNEYKNNITKKEKNLLNSKEKILNLNKIYKYRNQIQEGEIQSSRTHTNFDTVEFSKLDKSPPPQQNKGFFRGMNEEKEIVFNEFENPHLETEGDDVENFENHQKDFLSNSFTFKKDGNFKNELYYQKSKSEKRMQNIKIQSTKNKKFQIKEIPTHINLLYDNRSIKTDNSIFHSKRDSLKNKLKKQLFKKTSSNQIKKKSNINLNFNNVGNKIEPQRNNFIIDKKGKIEYNETIINQTSENINNIINSNFMIKSNNLNIPTVHTIKNFEGAKKTKILNEKKLNNISGNTNSNIVNLNLTSERIHDYNSNSNLAQNPANTPNHNYNKSIQMLNSLTNAKNNDRVSNKINQILYQQNKKSSFNLRNQSKTPNNNQKNYNSKLKGQSPKPKGIIQLNLNNDSITNSILNNTNNISNFPNQLNLSKDCFLNSNIVLTQNSIDSDGKSVNNNFMNSEEYEGLMNLKTNSNANIINLNNHDLQYNKYLINSNGKNIASYLNKNVNVINKNIKKLNFEIEDAGLGINGTINSLENSKEKIKKFQINVSKCINISKSKSKKQKNEKFVKYPTLKEKNNDYMLLKEEFSYYNYIENNNSINFNEGNNEKINLDNFNRERTGKNLIKNTKKNNDPNYKNHSKKSDLNSHNNYIHTTDDEEFCGIDNNSKFNNFEDNFLNENFTENSTDNINEDLNQINFNLENNRTLNNIQNIKKDLTKKKGKNIKDNNAYMIYADSDQKSENDYYSQAKDIEDCNTYPQEYYKEAENNGDILDTNQSLALSNSNIKENKNNSYNQRKNEKSFNKNLNIIQFRKETIETSEQNNCNENFIKNEFININFKGSGMENLIDSELILNQKKTHKSKSKSNNIKENISGNSNNFNSEISVNYNGKIRIKNPLTQNSGGANYFQGLQHNKNGGNSNNYESNNNDKNISKNSDQILNINPKDLMRINSGKKISPIIERKNFETNTNYKPNNLNMKFNYVDMTAKNQRKINTGQFININLGSKERFNDRQKHNYININYTK